MACPKKVWYGCYQQADVLHTEHAFGRVELSGCPVCAGKLYGRINWRIPKGSNDDFLERTAIQTFDQQKNPAVLFNHNNECASSPVPHLTRLLYSCICVAVFKYCTRHLRVTAS